MKRAWRRCGNRLNAKFDLAKRWQRAIKLHGGFWGPHGTCFAQVLKPSKCSISTWQGNGKGRWQSAGKGLKLHGRVWGPGGTCFAQALKPSLNAVFRRGKAMAKGERCTGGFPVLVKRAWRRGGHRLNAIFDLAKRCGKGLKLHGGFWGPGGTCFAQVLKSSKCSISTWQGKGKGRWQSAGKGLKLHGRVWGPGGTCFAQVLKSSKCRISTWQGRGKGRKVHSRVSCPSETCLAQVWKPV